MNVEKVATPVHVPPRILAALSVGLFWLVPFSPFLSIAAVKATEKTIGWPRQGARAGATLTIVWVGVMAAAILWIGYIVILSPSLA